MANNKEIKLSVGINEAELSKTRSALQSLISDFDRLVQAANKMGGSGIGVTGKGGTQGGKDAKLLSQTPNLGKPLLQSVMGSNNLIKGLAEESKKALSSMTSSVGRAVGDQKQHLDNLGKYVDNLIKKYQNLSDAMKGGGGRAGEGLGGGVKGGGKGGGGRGADSGGGTGGTEGGYPSGSIVPWSGKFAGKGGRFLEGHVFSGEIVSPPSPMKEIPGGGFGGLKSLGGAIGEVGGSGLGRAAWGLRGAVSGIAGGVAAVGYAVNRGLDQNVTEIMAPSQIAKFRSEAGRELFNRAAGLDPKLAIALASITPAEKAALGKLAGSQDLAAGNKPVTSAEALKYMNRRANPFTFLYDKIKGNQEIESIGERTDAQASATAINIKMYKDAAINAIKPVVGSGSGDAKFGTLGAFDQRVFFE